MSTECTPCECERLRLLGDCYCWEGMSSGCVAGDIMDQLCVAVEHLMSYVFERKLWRENSFIICVGEILLPQCVSDGVDHLVQGIGGQVGMKQGVFSSAGEIGSFLVGYGSNEYHIRWRSYSLQ